MSEESARAGATTCIAPREAMGRTGARKDGGSRELPFRRIAQFWNWLPAFRAVAEAGGVNEAARLLHVSPSALSRSVGLLEAALGERLFFRDGGLAPTAFGERLLSATRGAMRMVHDATESDAAATGPITFASTSRLGFYRLLPTLRSSRRRWPDLEARTSTIRDEDVAPLLLRGQVDIVVTMSDRHPKGLAHVTLPPAVCHVYCAKGHPLFGEKHPSEGKVEAHAFAAPVGPPVSAVATDSWPIERPRKIGLACDSIEPAIDACVSGELLVCLPDEIVTALGLTSRLRALPAPALPSIRLACVHRRPVGESRSLLRELVASIEATGPAR